MADGVIQVPADDVGKKVDVASLDVGANTVYRQRVIIGDNTGTATFAVVTSGSLQVLFNTPPTINNISAVVAVSGGVAISGTAVVSGVVGLTAGTAVIGDINAISRTVQVAVGTPFTVNNISATVVVSGQVGLTAGTAVIGDINAISRTVQVAIGTPFTVNNVSATVTVQGNVNISATHSVILAAGTANIGTLNNISANVSVNPVNISNTPSVILAAGTAVFGTLNNISATVVVGNALTAPLNMAFVEKTTNSQVLAGDSANAAIRVNVVAGSAGGPAVADNATFTVGAGAAQLAPIGGLLDDVGTTSASEGAAAIARITVMRALHANLRLTTGTAVDDTANTAIRVNVVAGGAAGNGTSIADRGAFTEATTSFNPVGGVFNDTVTSAVAEDQGAAVRITAWRAYHVHLRDDSGSAVGIAGAPLIVGGTIDKISATGSVVLAAGTANFGTLNNISATVVVSGLVGLTAGSSVIGDINAISRTVQVAIGTPFTVNNISATVVVAGAVTISLTPSVVLAAGTANFGTLNNISASVQVATGATADFNTLASADQVQNLPLFGFAMPAANGAVAGGTSSVPIAIVAMAGVNNIGVINNISATVIVALSMTPSVVLAAGTANFGTLNNISATVSVIIAAGTANIGTLNNISANVSVNPVNISNTPSVVLAAGTANFGTLNGISATVTVAVRSRYTNLSVQSASRGPRMVLASTSAAVALVAAPGAGLAIYVTMIAASNASGSNTRGRFGTSASVGTITMMLAGSGGGFVMQMEPPWKLSTNEALNVSVKPNASEGIFNCQFFVASADAL